MYRKNFKRVPSSSASNVPKPVVMSQKRVVSGKENEDEEMSQNVFASQDVPSSQNAEETYVSQSRFLSQRHIVSRTTQDHQIRGKNYFEIALLTSKIKVTELGCEFIDEGDDPISFTRRFRAFLTSASVECNNENAKKFIAGFKAAFNLQQRDAQKFLTGCIMKESQKTVQSQTSLVQCFFAVSSLKDEIAKILLDNLKKYVVERGELADGFIVGLIVAQFKFSDQMLTADAYNTVYERLFEILESVKSKPCREVIIEHFRDLDEFKQDEAVKRLLNLYEDEQENLTPFIEMFTEMSLNEDTKVRITSLINYLLDNNCEPELYPGIVKYLLHYMNSSDEIVASLRKSFKWKPRSSVSSTVIQLLEKSVRHEKSKMSEAWIKAIVDSEKPENLKIIDFVMLLAIVSVAEEKLPSVKKIFLQKVPFGFFSDDFMKKCFRTFSSMIVQYSETLLELLNALQKSNVYEINEFSSICFKELFAIDSSDKKEIVGSLVQFLCEKTAQNPFSARSDFKMMTLSILDEISKEQSSAEALLINHKILLRVLDVSKVKLTFNEHRLMLELLCTLAYTTNYKNNHNALEARKLEEERAVLQEHLEMMTHKLNSNPDMNIKQLGIIAAVKTISAQVVNVVMSSEGIPDPKIDDIPAGPIRDAATRVTFIIDSVKGNAVGLGIVYDELTLEFSGKGNKFQINEMFLVWLSGLMMDKFINISTIAIDAELPDVEGVTLINKLSEEDADASQANFAIQLGHQVFHTKSDDVIFIPSLFKLTTVLLLHQASSLNDLGAFAFMPITLTEKFNTSDEEISMDESVAKNQFDLYFHCINWLREYIGAYCHQTETDGEIFDLVVVKRLKQLVSIEKKLIDLLKDVPSNYYPPPASFLDIEFKKKLFDGLRKEKKVVQKLTKPPKKTRKKNDSSLVNATRITPADQFETENKIRQFCREIDTHSIVLLKKKFNFRSRNIPDNEFGLQELVFLLDDVFHKIKPIFSSRSSEQKGLFNPIKAFRDIKEAIVTEIASIFNGICEELVSLSQQADKEDCNDVFFTNDANMIKCSFSLILQLFEVLFSCPKLQLEMNRELIKETLEELMPNELLTDDDIYLNVVQRFVALQVNVKNIDSAVSLVKFLLTVTRLSSNPELHSLVQELCETFLQREWMNWTGGDEHGAAFNSNLEKLLQIFTEGVKFDDLEKKFMQMADDFQNIITKKLEFQKTFPSFNRSNSIYMIRTYLSRLSNILSSTDPNRMDYDFWMRTTKIFNQVTDVVKCIDQQNAFVVFLKEVQVFLRVFNSSGINVLKQTIKDKKKFTELCKSVQTVTRFSHGVSCELKHRKNKSVVAIMPKFREAHMKNYQLLSSLLHLAGIPSSEIHLGSLKNFDLNNDAIWSQNSHSTTSNDSVDGSCEEDESMNVSDDETVGNLNVSNPEPSSIRSRSTIL